MRSDDIIGYTFQAELYTPFGVLEALYSHPNFEGWRNVLGVRSVETELDEIAAAFGIDRTDEYSFDSDEFPKVVFVDQANDDDWAVDSDGAYVRLLEG